MSDEEVPTLSADALAALNAFRVEQELKEEELKQGKISKIDEDWQLSQFWYDDETSRKLVKEAIAAIGKGRIACVSSPTLMKFLHETEQYRDGRIEVNVFEYDTRFGVKYPNEFVLFDYKKPKEIPEEMMGRFDMIIADPPFLAPECLIKTAHTIRLIGKQDAKILLCTGAIMEEYADRLLGLHRTGFEPRHANNLANDFACFANYQTITL